jgi:hypothetical protein
LMTQACDFAVIIHPLNRFRPYTLDLKVSITLAFETTEDVIDARALLNLASGDIDGLAFDDYDPDAEGLPWKRKDYEFAAGTLSNNGRDVEFKVDVDGQGRLSISASELLELKTRAAALFTSRPQMGDASGGKTKKTPRPLDGP